MARRKLEKELEMYKEFAILAEKYGKTSSQLFSYIQNHRKRLDEELNREKYIKKINNALANGDVVLLKAICEVIK